MSRGLTPRPIRDIVPPPKGGGMTVEELGLIAALKANADLARLVERVARADLPWVVVSPAAIAAWEREDPAGWAKVSEWLAVKGVAVVRI